jgi:hypothetical protein
MKEHMHDYNKYITSVTLPNIVMSGLISLYCIYKILLGETDSFQVVLLVLTSYVLFNTLVSGSYPSSVSISTDVIVFKSYRKKHIYKIDEIKKFYVKGLADKGMYIRIEGGSLTRGRYFIKTKKFSDGDELFDAICKIEVAKNTKSIFVKKLKY